MTAKQAIDRQLLAKDLTDVLIRVGLIAFIVYLSFKIFSPFMGLMLWALILAVMLYPLHQRIASHLGGKQGRAATLLVVAFLVLISVPAALLGSSFAAHAYEVYDDFVHHQIEIAKPDPSVADWPLVGKKLYSTWEQAATNLPALLEKSKPQLESLAKKLASAAASTAGSLLSFIGSMIIAGIMMAYGRSGSEVMRRIYCRLTDPVKGPKLHQLSTATVRSVAAGIIGVAAIQALLLGIGFMIAGIPAAGVLALVVLVIGILQLPALVITLPVILYLWGVGDASTTANIFYTIYLLVAGMVDGPLKPILLGRGVEAPMPIILIGALGGMISTGIIGLFVGAVVMAVGYRLFMEWVAESDAGPAEGTGPATGGQ